MDNSVKIYFAPRFHVNLNHSYRGDTPDEKGFGKDIRIIRNILDDLEALEKEGIVVHCAWDADNAFSLGEMLPQYAPDIILRIKDRVERNIDEIHIMSWNNGLLSVMSEEEFFLAVGWAIESPTHDGVKDIFDKYVPVVRPQECMYTPNHIHLYKKLGVEFLSIYYSAIPFNGFSSFIPRLHVEQQYNPIRLEHPITKESMRILPSCNQGDLAEYGMSLKRMVKRLRKKQMKQGAKYDFLILLDMDADDSFWDSSTSSLLQQKIVPSFSGLYSLIKSISKLSYIEFNSAYQYGRNHEDLTTISLGQDLADGAFDGFASWAEKWDNFMLWPSILKAREIYDKAIKCFSGNEISQQNDEMSPTWELLPAELKETAQEAMSARLRALSTTHFGLSAPVMNIERLSKGKSFIEKSIKLSTSLLLEGEKNNPVVDQKNCENKPKYCIRTRKDLPLVSLYGDIEDGNVIIHSLWINYGGKKRLPNNLQRATENLKIYLKGSSTLPGRDKPTIIWERKVSSIEIDGYKALDIETMVNYPETTHNMTHGIKKERIGRSWDDRWIETAPCEIEVFKGISSDKIVTVWKEDTNGNISNYSLDYIRNGSNQRLSSINNHITPHWIALSDGTHGVLLVYKDNEFKSFASCPLRQILLGKEMQILMNPYGTYWGKQYHYPSRVSGLGRLGAIVTAEHLHPSAPSWEGKEFSFRLLLIHYEGDAPHKDLLRITKNVNE